MRIALIINGVVAGIAEADQKYIDSLVSLGVQVVPVGTDDPVSVGDLYEDGKFVYVEEFKP